MEKFIAYKPEKEVIQNNNGKKRGLIFQSNFCIRYIIIKCYVTSFHDLKWYKTGTNAHCAHG